MGFVKHPSVVAGVHEVPPAILGWINVDLWNAEHAHLLKVPVAVQPTHPMAPRRTTKPNVGRAEPEVHWSTLVW